MAAISKPAVPCSLRGSVWLFTVNAVGGTPHPVKPHLEITKTGNGLLYYKYQLEKGEVDARLHYQGCLRFSASVSMETVKRTICVPHAHLERAMNWKKTRDYCGKEETRVDGPWEDGDPGAQGKRTDLDAVATMVKEGKTLTAIAEEFPREFIKFGRGISQLQAALTVPGSSPDIEVYCLYGGAGVGKTRCVYDLDPGVFSADLLPWFDQYAGEPSILFDDFGPGMLPICLLKKYLDRYPVRFPIKGGSVVRQATRIWITSNYQMAEWYPKAGPVDLMALIRRIQWFNFDDPAVIIGFYADYKTKHAVIPPPPKVLPLPERGQQAQASSSGAATTEEDDADNVDDLEVASNDDIDVWELDDDEDLQF